MGFFKMMSSSNSDLSSASSSSSYLRQQDTFASGSNPIGIEFDRSNGDRNSFNGGGRRNNSVDDVWKEIVSGKTIIKEETHEQEENLMTLEDFLAKAAMDDSDEIDFKVNIPPPERFNSCPMIGGGKRGRGMMMVEDGMMDNNDKALAQRQKRMIKNRESAARSRERKHAYQVELETLAKKLEEENEQLMKEIEESTKERYNKLMEQLVPVNEKPKQSSLALPLSRSYSL